MTTDDLIAAIRRYGVSAKLKMIVMKAFGWKHDSRGLDHDDWYKNWPWFSSMLEAAAREAKP